jgi:hypothetical protein
MKKATLRFLDLLLLIVLAIAAWLFVSRYVVEGRHWEIPDEPIEQLDESIDWSISEGERSGEWRRVRDEFVEKFPFCAACGTSAALNVHHVEPFHIRPELELDPSNLLTLCREHHFRIGHDPDGPWRPKKPNWSASNPLVREHAQQFLRGRKY